MNNLKLCKDRNEDCFAYFYGRCKALGDTNFCGKQCPFYKTIQQVIKEDPAFYVRCGHESKNK